MSRRPRSKAESAGSEEKTVAELQLEVQLLEKTIEERELSLLGRLNQRGAAGATGHDSFEGTSPKDPGEEARHLARRNAFLRDELTLLEAMERRYASDPHVRDKRNEVRLVEMQIAQAERDVETLQVVRKRRNKGLRAIGDTEEKARRMRGQQELLTSELREEARQLMEVLRELQKKDIELHERCARLKDQVKLSVTDADVRRLKQELEEQRVEIEKLAHKEAMTRKERSSMLEEEQRAVERQRRECAQLSEEVTRLQSVLHQKDLELKRTYQLLVRCGVRPDRLMDAATNGGDDGVMGELPAAS
ncbi:hypothetical protein JKF63_03510 [Porcisia hertigi]|uniref:Uncharacterized protein n=1 Tax=Porcisia hertigi TaxID=2761500 RepID=A0A836I8I3_9TRYP|nr:hypothetical protein JKF63_03510 [Porcisia hertigi]